MNARSYLLRWVYTDYNYRYSKYNWWALREASERSRSPSGSRGFPRREVCEALRAFRKAKTNILKRPKRFLKAFRKYFKSIILASTYSSAPRRGSTIGDEWLNFCVRDGNRCTPLSIDTKMMLLNLWFVILDLRFKFIYLRFIIFGYQMTNFKMTITIHKSEITNEQLFPLITGQSSFAHDSENRKIGQKEHNE